MKEIIKRAKNVKEVFFVGFDPSMEVIEMLPEHLEHLPYLQLGEGDEESYSRKFRRLKSLRLTDYGFDFLIFVIAFLWRNS